MNSPCLGPWCVLTCSQNILWVISPNSETTPKLAGNWSDWPRAWLLCKKPLRWSVLEESSYPPTSGSWLSSLVSPLSFLLVELHSPLFSTFSSGCNLASWEKVLNQNLGLGGWPWPNCLMSCWASIYSLKKKKLFIWERESTGVGVWGRRGSGKRISSRLCAECRAWCRVWQHLEIMTWAETKSGTLSRLSHPGAP